MAKIVVTGAAGFIGSWISRELAKQGHHVFGVDDLSGGSMDNLPDEDDFEFYRNSCNDEEAMEYLFREFQPEYVYHLAANAREGASFFQPVSIVKRNILAYSVVLMNAIKYGVKRMVLFSSMSVYGSQQAPFTEDMSRQPVDIYGLQKANMEEMTEMLSRSHGIEYVIIRPHNVFGPGQCLSDIHRNVFGIWFNKLLREEPITIYGDGSQTRAFSYIEDSLPCYLKAIEPEIPSGTIVNIGGDRPISIRNAANLAIAAMGYNYEYPIEFLPGRHQEVKHAYTDHTLARSMFGLKDKHSIAEGLIKMAEWAQGQGPQEWTNTDQLEIPNKLTPQMWIGKQEK